MFRLIVDGRLAAEGNRADVIAQAFRHCGAAENCGMSADIVVHQQAGRFWRSVYTVRVHDGRMETTTFN